MLKKVLLITFVESSLPPNPTSKIVHSALFLEKAKKATAVINSKKLSSSVSFIFIHSAKRNQSIFSISFSAI